MSDEHVYLPQPGCNVCLCGLTAAAHDRDARAVADALGGGSDPPPPLSPPMTVDDAIRRARTVTAHDFLPPGWQMDREALHVLEAEIARLRSADPDLSDTEGRLL